MEEGEVDARVAEVAWQLLQMPEGVRVAAIAAIMTSFREETAKALKLILQRGSQEK